MNDGTNERQTQMWQTYDRENEQTNEWEKQLTYIEIRSELKRILKYRFELNETAKQASKQAKKNIYTKIAECILFSSLKRQRLSSRYVKPMEL